MANYQKVELWNQLEKSSANETVKRLLFGIAGILTKYNLEYNSYGAGGVFQINQTLFGIQPKRVSAWDSIIQNGVSVFTSNVIKSVMPLPAPNAITPEYLAWVVTLWRTPSAKTLASNKGETEYARWLTQATEVIKANPQIFSASTDSSKGVVNATKSPKIWPYVIAIGGIIIVWKYRKTIKRLAGLKGK